jgi:hypothetical protein
MGLKFRRGTTAQKSGSLAFGEPYVNTDLGTLQIGGATGDITLGASGTGSQGSFAGISGSSLDITGNAKIDGNLTLGGAITIGDATADTVNVVASLSSSLIPSVTNAFDLGSTSKVWKDLYISTGSIKFVEGSTVVGTLSSNTFNAISGGYITFSQMAPRIVLNDTANVIVGNQSISGNILITGSIIPGETNTYDLGSETKFWRDLYISTGSIKFVGAAGAIVGTLSNSGNGMSLDGGVVTRGDSSFGTSSLAVTSVTGSLKVSGSLTTIGATTTSELKIQSGSQTQLRLINNATGIEYHIKNSDAGNFQIHNGITEALLFSFQSASAAEGNQNAVFYSDVFVSESIHANSLVAHEVAASHLTGSLSGSVFGIGDPVQYSASVATTFAKINSANIFTGNQTITGSLYITQDLVVQGSSSIQNITSSNLAIGAAFVTLNALTPSSNFAGIKVVDSGSTFTTASFIYDGLNNNWVFEKANVGSSDTSVAIFGPISTNGLGTELGLTQNKLPKAVSSHGHHIGDSNISDDGTNISLNSNTQITGSLRVSAGITGSIAATNGVVSGSSQITYASISSIPAGIVSGSSQVTLSSTTGYGTVINQNLLTTSDVRHNSLGIGMDASATAGRIDAANDIVAYSSSDIRFKENITPIQNALDKISKISGNTYDWKAENKIEHGYEGNDVGVIAQEIEAVLPQLVQTRENGFKAVKYDKLVALLIQGIKEQQLQIEELKAKIGL